MRALLGLTFVSLAITGCSGGGGGRPSPQHAAATIHCQGYKPTSPELFAATQGDCTVDGQDVSLLTFATTAAEDKWASAAKQATGGDGTTVVAHMFAVEASDVTEAGRIAAEAHGHTQ